MELYIKNKKGQLEQTSLYDVLKNKLNNDGFKVKADSFSDESSRWLAILQESEKPAIVCINITFDYDSDNIQDINVYESPIITIIDDDNMKKIV